MKTALKALIFVFALCAWFSLANAQDYPTRDPKIDCADDVTQFCKSVKSNPEETTQCLEDHYREISDECYAALKEQDDSESSDAANDPGASADSGGDDPRMQCRNEHKQFAMGWNRATGAS